MVTRVGSSWPTVARRSPTSEPHVIESCSRIRVFSCPHFSEGTASTTAAACFRLGLGLGLGDIICKPEQRATPHGEIDRAEVAREATHLHHDADDPVLGYGSQSQHGARRWVLLRGFGEERVAGVLAESPQ